MPPSGPVARCPTPANAEVVRVTARTTDTLTIARAQEGTTARAMAAGRSDRRQHHGQDADRPGNAGGAQGRGEHVHREPQTICTATRADAASERYRAPADARDFDLLNYTQDAAIARAERCASAVHWPTAAASLGRAMSTSGRNLYEAGPHDARSATGRPCRSAERTLPAVGGTDLDGRARRSIRRPLHLIGKTADSGLYRGRSAGDARVAPQLHVADCRPAGRRDRRGVAATAQIARRDLAHRGMGARRPRTMPHRDHRAGPTHALCRSPARLRRSFRDHSGDAAKWPHGRHLDATNGADPRHRPRRVHGTGAGDAGVCCTPRS